jgi:hypothetical protein
MRRFIERLKEKPYRHKRRFALFVSAVFTLSIFAIWSLVNFGSGGIISQKIDNRASSQGQTNEVSPLESVQMNLASSFEALLQSIDGLKETFNSSFQPEYYEMMDNTFEIYGQ